MVLSPINRVQKLTTRKCNNLHDYAQVIKQTIPALSPNDPSEPIGCGETDGDRGIKDLCLSEGFEQSDQIPPDLDPSNPCWDS